MTILVKYLFRYFTDVILRDAVKLTLRLQKYLFHTLLHLYLSEQETVNALYHQCKSPDICLNYVNRIKK